MSLEYLATFRCFSSAIPLAFIDRGIRDSALYGSTLVESISTLSNPIGIAYTIDISSPIRIDVRTANGYIWQGRKRTDGGTRRHVCSPSPCVHRGIVYCNRSARRTATYAWRHCRVRGTISIYSYITDGDVAARVIVRTIFPISTYARAVTTSSGGQYITAAAAFYDNTATLCHVDTCARCR